MTERLRHGILAAWMGEERYPQSPNLLGAVSPPASLGIDWVDWQSTDDLHRFLEPGSGREDL